MAHNDGGAGAGPQALTQYGFVFVAVKGKNKVKIAGVAAFHSEQSARDTLFMVASRDSRILEAYLTDEPRAKTVLWGCVPGQIRAMMEASGFTPDILTFPGAAPSRG
jgi:hypothetical protein